MSRGTLSRILPFALFMLVIGCEEGVRFLQDKQLLQLAPADFALFYPVRPLLALIALVVFWKDYNELQWKDLNKVGDTLLSILLGLVVFFLWINMDWTFGVAGDAIGFNPDIFQNQTAKWTMIVSHIASAALVVPIMEELFWRSFLIRYVISPNFLDVPIGKYTLNSFVVGAILFGLEHHFIIAGIMAGMAYSLLLYRTKSIVQCVLSHAVTNFVLGLYVMNSQQWKFW